MKRYGVIEEKNKREIVLLQGSGCKYKRCSFCDYYLDVGEQSYELNCQALNQVRGHYGILEVVNSGSFDEIDSKSMAKILEVAKERGVHTLIFECHYLYRSKIAKLKEYFSDFRVKLKLGLESFDYDFREGVLKKGIKIASPKEIAKDFDEANFLIGVSSQSGEMIKKDIALGLEHFERICLNVMCDNSKMKADRGVIEIFLKEIYPQIKDNPRIDILLENTDFGIGECE
ncbi:radical SAM protein [Helicobacter brantae]|uniref:Radical SAM protein n=1 Tax=Helicobacter brantae TaxID=375927 RepID=A0A3D8IW50_9HELI|nr:radical SAM protein [Helicobacter brantae]RDU68854.1 radical SAM protein [Helicobacter brantae]